MSGFPTRLYWNVSATIFLLQLWVSHLAAPEEASIPRCTCLPSGPPADLSRVRISHPYVVKWSELPYSRDEKSSGAVGRVSRARQSTPRRIARPRTIIHGNSDGQGDVESQRRTPAEAFYKVRGGLFVAARCRVFEGEVLFLPFGFSPVDSRRDLDGGFGSFRPDGQRSLRFPRPENQPAKCPFQLSLHVLEPPQIRTDPAELGKPSDTVP